MRVKKEIDYCLTDKSFKMKKSVVILSIAILIGVFSACSNSESKQSLEGVEVIESYANGNPRIEREYEMVDGKKTAVYEREYYADKQIIKEGPLDINESRDGRWKSFRQDGKVWSEGEYQNGARQGKTITYHPNGNIYYEGQFNKGQKCGVWKFHKESGEFDYEMDMDKKRQAKVTVNNDKMKKGKK